MAERNIEVLRRAIDGFNRRDLEATLAVVDPEVRFESALVEKQTYHGYEGLIAYRKDLDESWSEWLTADDEFVAVGPDEVLHLYRIVGRGRGSGIPVDKDIAVLWTLRDGRIVHGKVFLDQDEARAAAGIEAQT